MLHVGERIEEEMRLDLRLHQRQLRFQQVLGELVAFALGWSLLRRLTVG